MKLIGDQLISDQGSATKLIDILGGKTHGGRIRELNGLAEGHGRFYYRDRVRFCYNARGSLSETENHLRDARDLTYISESIYRRDRDLAADAQRLLNGYTD